MSAIRRLQRRAIHVAAGETAVVVVVRQAFPAFVLLAPDVGLARFALGVERVEFLVEAFVGGLAGVDGAADGAGVGDVVVFLVLVIARSPCQGGRSGSRCSAGR